MALGNRQGCPDSVKGYVLTALCKVACQGGATSPDIEAFISKNLVSRNLDLQQRALEFQGLIGCDGSAKAMAMPVDASCEEFSFQDGSMSLVDQYVQDALASGAAPYIDETLRDGGPGEGGGPGRPRRPAGGAQ